MAHELPHYAAWIRQQPCQACGQPARCEAHHHTRGSMVPFGEQPKGKQLGGKRGKSQTPHDSWLLSLHLKCHADLHRGKGMFHGWSEKQRADWETEQVKKNLARYESEHGSTLVTNVVERPKPKRAKAGERKRLRAELGHALDLARAAHRAADEAVGKSAATLTVLAELVRELDAMGGDS